MTFELIMENLPGHRGDPYRIHSDKGISCPLTFNKAQQFVRVLDSLNISWVNKCNFPEEKMRRSH